MITPDAGSTAEASVNAGRTVASGLTGPPARPDEQHSHEGEDTRTFVFHPPSSTPPGRTAKSCSGTCGRLAGGLTQTEAEERARTVGPNEVAQERRQGWPVRLLKIIRNPLVILLATLSAVSFVTGDARAGTVMAAMVVLSVALRFFQEARADAAAAKLKAMIHVTATVIRDGDAREMPLRDLVPGRYHQAVRGRHDPGRRAGALFQRPLRQPGEPHRGVAPCREVPRPRDQRCELTD